EQDADEGTCHYGQGSGTRGQVVRDEAADDEAPGGNRGGNRGAEDRKGPPGTLAARKGEPVLHRLFVELRCDVFLNSHDASSPQPVRIIGTSIVASARIT